MRAGRCGLALCVCVGIALFAGRARGGFIIDENFDAVRPISLMSMMMLSPMDVGMWFAGMDMGSMWSYSTLNKRVEFGVGMGMSMMGFAWNTLVYFVPKPAAGWGGMELNFDLVFASFDASPGARARFGVYGLNERALIDLNGARPVPNQDPLISGDLPLGSGIRTGGNYIGNLDGFDYLATAITAGVEQPGGHLSASVKSVRLSIVPEPAIQLALILAVSGGLFSLRRPARRQS